MKNQPKLIIAAILLSILIFLASCGRSGGVGAGKEIVQAEMVFVPAGEFLMGRESGNADEVPIHVVYLDAFWIYKTEVTHAMYQLCVDAGACEAPVGEIFGQEEYSDHPVGGVSWENANAFCVWAGGRLPTEAEWEKAARGTVGLTYPWGEDLDCGHANYAGCEEGTMPVGNYPQGASPYGALDMSGNVQEWVGDWYAEDYYQNSPYENPTGPENGSYRVLRGGSWEHLMYLETTSRKYFAPGSTAECTGFRCVVPGGP